MVSYKAVLLKPIPGIEPGLQTTIDIIYTGVSIYCVPILKIALLYTKPNVIDMTLGFVWRLVAAAEAAIPTHAIFTFSIGVYL